MYIGFCKIKLNIPYCHSLKEKRQILKPLFNSLNKNFNIAIAETENHNFWQSTEIGIVTVNNDKIFCQKNFSINNKLHN